MNRKPGDWDCRACQHLNFSRRDICQRCSEPRGVADRGSGGGGDYANFGGRGGSSFGGGFGAGSDVRPGDWYCSCGAHNFASRSSCFKCSAYKEEAAVNSGAGGFDSDMSRSRGYGFGSGAARTNRPGWKSGDWICTRCVLLDFILPPLLKDKVSSILSYFWLCIYKLSNYFVVVDGHSITLDMNPCACFLIDYGYTHGLMVVVTFCMLISSCDAMLPCFVVLF